jgi:hypothetical protein
MSPFKAEAFARPKSAANIRRASASRRWEPTSGSVAGTSSISFAESSRLLCAVPVVLASSSGRRA